MTLEPWRNVRVINVLREKPWNPSDKFAQCEKYPWGMHVVVKRGHKKLWNPLAVQPREE